MDDILLAVLLLAVFVGGYFAVARFGKFLVENHRGHHGQPPEAADACAAETNEQSAGAAHTAARAAQPFSFPEEYEIILRKNCDPAVAAQSERVGFLSEQEAALLKKAGGCDIILFCKRKG